MEVVRFVRAVYIVVVNMGVVVKLWMLPLGDAWIFTVQYQDQARLRGNEKLIKFMAFEARSWRFRDLPSA